MQHFKQKKKYSCGPACARMILNDVGICSTEFDLVKKLRTDKKTGTHPQNFKYLGTKLHSDIITDCDINTIKSLLTLGQYVIAIVTMYDCPHYVLVTGVVDDKIIFNDPIMDHGDTVMNIKDFTAIWHTVGDWVYQSQQHLVTISKTTKHIH